MKTKKSLLTIRCRLMVLLLTFIVVFAWPVWSASQALPNTATNTVLAAQPSISSSSAATNSPQGQPQVIVYDCWGWILVLVAVAIIVGAIWYTICQLGLCGNHGDQPPQAPNNGNNGNNSIFIKSAPINTNVALPTTVFFISNGLVVSNSAGLSMSSLPSFLSLNGAVVTNGSQINSIVPGTTTPPSIAVWAETNVFYDATLDPNYHYVVIYNYSLLTTTNLTTGWHELYTVVGWVNNNPKIPLACNITYTNGVPVTTNWTQFVLDNRNQPTNIVVYGALPSVAMTNNQSVFHPADGPFPGPGGTPIVISTQFYRLVANTNDIVTQWP